MDDQSGNNVAWGIDSEEYAWGVFLDRELIGYCTLGGADDTALGYKEFVEWNFDSLCLSDVYIKEEYRGKGLASLLVEKVIEYGNSNNESVFLTVMDDNLAVFYEKLGFKPCEDFEMTGIMVRDYTLGLDEIIKDASEKKVPAQIDLSEPSFEREN